MSGVEPTAVEIAAAVRLPRGPRRRQPTRPARTWAGPRTGPGFDEDPERERDEDHAVRRRREDLRPLVPEGALRRARPPCEPHGDGAGVSARLSESMGTASARARGSRSAAADDLTAVKASVSAGHTAHAASSGSNGARDPGPGITSSWMCAN